VFRGSQISTPVLARAKEWISSFSSLGNALEQGRLNLYQIRDDTATDDPGGKDKATALLLETTVQLKSRANVDTLILLHYRGTDPFNRDFQSSQARRLGDFLGIDWLRTRDAGIFLSVHHETMGRPDRFEIGDHRVVCNFQQLDLQPQCGAAVPVISEVEDFISIPELSADAKMVWRVGECSIRPLGVMPGSTLAVGSPLCPSPSNSPEFNSLVRSALDAYQCKRARIIFDSKSEFATAALSFQSAGRFWTSAVAVESSDVALTAIPKGLAPTHQEALVASEWPAYLPFLPWHSGRFVLGSGF
jgi:hypothetical protein